MSAKKNRIYFLTQVAAHRLRKLADRRLGTGAGVSTTQAAVLGIIDREGPLHQRDIARILHQNESAITAMIGRLQKAGLVRRIRSKSDGRAWVVELTEDGRYVRDKVAPLFSGVNELLDQALGDQADSFARQLESVIAALDEDYNV